MTLKRDMAKVINYEKYRLLLSRSCNIGKHKLRENNFGIVWCVNCGILSSGDVLGKLEEDDKLLIVNEDELYNTRTE